jgi:NADH dehydrogenase
LLYQVATAGLSPADIAMPVRSVLSNKPDTEVLMAKVRGIDAAGRIVHLDRGDAVSYDYLVLATGARHSYFGRDDWERLAPGLKTLEDATEIRRRILVAFEDAERSTDPAERAALLTFVIVGGGPTGIELAGAIAELARFALARDFVHINPRLATVLIVEAGPRLLREFAPELAQRATRALHRLGVRIETNKRVTEITDKGADVGGEFVPARTVIWAAGVLASPLGQSLGVPLDAAGRVLVEADLSIPGRPEIFVAGDLAAARWTSDAFVPGMAPGAMQEGRHAARNILRRIAGQPTTPFRYRHKGSLATIGRAAAVADLGFIKMGGFIAWVAWLTVHIFYLIGFRNRLVVLIQWAWSYFTFQRGTRLITGNRPR